MDFGVLRGDKPNAAEMALAEKARDRAVLSRVKVSDVAIVERYNARTGRVDARLKFDDKALTRYNIPVLWGKHRRPLKKGDMGLLIHTHDDSAGGFDNRLVARPETPGTHMRDTPVFDAREPIVINDALDARWDINSLVTDYGTFGPLDEIIFLTGGGYVIVKSNGNVTLIPGPGGKIRIGDPSSTDAVLGISKVLSASTTWNPPSLPNLSSASTTVTVMGARVGDACTVSHANAGAGWLISALVTGNDTVTVTLLNATGGTVDLSSGSLKVVVIGG